MRKHFLRVSGVPNLGGYLPKVRLCTPELKIEKIVSISIQSVQVFFKDLRQYEANWEIRSSFVGETVWQNKQLEESKAPLANFLVKKDPNFHQFSWNGNIWFDVTNRENFLELQLIDPIIQSTIHEDIIVYIIVGIETC